MKKIKINFKSKKTMALFLVAVGFSVWMFSFYCFHQDRGPAAIEQQPFFNFLDNKNTLSDALQEDIIESIKIAKKQKNFQVDIRNFMVKNSKENLHLCEYFTDYTLTFEAEGIATSGERPSMVVSSICQISLKTNLPVPLLIPVEDIFKLKPADTDISFQIAPKTSFSFRNVSDMWPEYWVLSKIQFSHKDFSNREVIIDRREIYKFSKNPLVMSWD